MVCLSVCDAAELCKNGWMDRGPVQGGDWGLKAHCIRWSLDRHWPEKWASKQWVAVHALDQECVEQDWWWSCYYILCIRRPHLYLPSSQSAAVLGTWPGPCDPTWEGPTSWTASNSTPSGLCRDYICSIHMPKRQMIIWPICCSHFLGFAVLAVNSKDSENVFPHIEWKKLKTWSEQFKTRMLYSWRHTTRLLHPSGFCPSGNIFTSFVAQLYSAQQKVL